MIKKVLKKKAQQTMGEMTVTDQVAKLGVHKKNNKEDQGGRTQTAKSCGQGARVHTDRTDEAYLACNLHT